MAGEGIKINLTNGAENAIGTISLAPVGGYVSAPGPWTCKEVQGYLYVQTADDGIYVYDMTNATTLGALYTHHTKAQLNTITKNTTSNYGCDVSDRGRSILLSAGSGRIAELRRAPCVGWHLWVR